jgi:ATP-dependent RNA helicase RhlE
VKSGTVKWFDNEKGYGFIEKESGGDLFVHYSEIKKDGYKTLDDGERVEFEAEETEKGEAAVNVKSTNGETETSPETSQNGSQPTTETGDSDRSSSEESAPDATFKELGMNDDFLNRLSDEGFDSPRPIQQKAIPSIFDKRDLVGTAPTGTGKTAAFLLPILQRLSKQDWENPRALVLAPTHELADQITEEARMLCPYDDIVIDSVYGGTDIWNEMERLKERVDLLVACPGRLLDHIGRQSVDLSDVEISVLDEADRMCDMGFLPDIKKILRRVPKGRQNLFFSATIPKDIQDLAEEMLEDPVKVSVGEQAPAETISHYLCEVKNGQKPEALKRILDNLETESVLVFCRTRNNVKSVARNLREQGYDASPLQGGMDSMAREATLSGFRRENFKILVATNVAARGLDVEHISHVINYDIPEDPDVYTHRIGRTGRSGSLGDAYTLVTPSDRDSVEAIERTIDDSIERSPVPGT